jgi:lysophospholipase L1-like esterase
MALRLRIGTALAGAAGALFGLGIGVPASAATPVVRIMPLGDSITYGVGSSSKSSYRADLYRRLTAAGVRADFVGSQKSGIGRDIDNEGHGGWTIDQIAAQLDEWLATSAPDVVLVHLGTNNITRREQPADTAAKLAALVDQIRAARPTAHILVSKIITPKVPAEIAPTRAYNALIPQIVASRDDRVRIVDQSGVAGIDLIDRHHPNDFGYQKMSYTWFRALEEVLNTGPTTWQSAGDPHLQTKVYSCQAKKVQRNGELVNRYYCEYWHLRDVVRTVSGKQALVKRWQTQRLVTEQYRTIVKGRLQTKTRRSPKWFGPEEFMQG